MGVWVGIAKLKRGESVVYCTASGWRMEAVVGDEKCCGEQEQTPAGGTVAFLLVLDCGTYVCSRQAAA